MINNLFLFVMLMFFQVNCSATDSFIYEEKGIQVHVSGYPLSEGSLLLCSLNKSKSIVDWSLDEQIASFNLMKKIDRIWFNRGITDYCLYGKEVLNSEDFFQWEMMPCPKRTSTEQFYLRFIRTIINVAYKANPLTPSEVSTLRCDMIKAFQNESFEMLSLAYVNKHEKKDIFCHLYKITHQIVYVGETINLLHDYAPIADIHFLLVTKEHRERGSDLTEEEFLEAMKMAQSLIGYYQSKGYPIANIHVKNGLESGQSQPHWHLQIALSKSRESELMSALEIVRDACLKFHQPLEKEVLKDKVKIIREELMENNVL